MNPMRIAQPQPVDRNVSKCAQRSLRASVTPAATVTTAATPLAVLQSLTTSSIRVSRVAGASFPHRGRKNKAMNSAEPTQKAPDTIWIILRLMSSMFISA